jgi:hypothetical protein
MDLVFLKIKLIYCCLDMRKNFCGLKVIDFPLYLEGVDFKAGHAAPTQILTDSTRKLLFFFCLRLNKNVVKCVEIFLFLLLIDKGSQLSSMQLKDTVHFVRVNDGKIN